MSVWVEIVIKWRRFNIKCVTLHVSVWVEIYHLALNYILNQRSRSTWACELKYGLSYIRLWRTLSRSTWACELKLISSPCKGVSEMSRSTWACELKFISNPEINFRCTGHAPRERVSWNFNVFYLILAGLGHAPRERVSWNISALYGADIFFVTLHVSVWVEITLEWYSLHLVSVTLHVSVWVEISLISYIIALKSVTLHVSVWVEIKELTNLMRCIMSRSTWACELKFLPKGMQGRERGHAPRERVSWNS